MARGKHARMCLTAIKGKDWVITSLLISPPNFTVENGSTDSGIQIHQRTNAWSTSEISAIHESINITSQFPSYE